MLIPLVSHRVFLSARLHGIPVLVRVPVLFGAGTVRYHKIKSTEVPSSTESNGTAYIKYAND